MKAILPLFEHTSWRILRDELIDAIDNTKQAIIAAPTWEATLTLRGELNQLENFISLENQLAILIDAEEAELDADV